MPTQYPMAGGGPSRSAAVAGGIEASGTFETRWQVPVSGPGSEPPVVLDGVAYVLEQTDAAPDPVYEIVGYDLSDGRGVRRLDCAEFGAVYELATDGRLLVVAADGVVTAINPKADQIAWRADGLIWETDDGPHEDSMASVAPTSETVYAAATVESAVSDEIMETKILRLNAGDGKGGGVGIYEQGAGGWNLPGTRLAVHDGLAFLLVDGVVVGLESRDEMWRASLAELDGVDVYSPAADGIAVGPQGVYVTLGHGGDFEKYVTAYDPVTGTERWRTPISQSGAKAVAVADGTVLAVSSGGVLALDAVDGDVLWENYDGKHNSKPAIAGETVYLGRTDGGSDVLVGLSLADGTEEWRHEVGFRIGHVLPLQDSLVVRGGRLARLEPADAARESGGTGKPATATDCPDCGASVDGSAEFCPDCGTELGDGETCPGCGSTLDGDESFCPDCGTELGDDETCPGCGSTLDGDESFCPDCGEEL
ncbi:PQQ-binding-like beta-propeller repeat protein [Haloglomus salinum]|uniref:outer membrane protein assembly factor BamB family protein n=1 Tax=Haloglomus salinum TaxID=2962673 RepID=UPI0020C9430F|nr:PQQ-binding-like beta-propeller repeat protein [Haloglomus salinum]